LVELTIKPAKKLKFLLEEANKIMNQNCNFNNSAQASTTIAAANEVLYNIVGSKKNNIYETIQSIGLESKESLIKLPIFLNHHEELTNNVRYIAGFLVNRLLMITLKY
jgi:hypothetical protein